MSLVPRKKAQQMLDRADHSSNNGDFLAAAAACEAAGAAEALAFYLTPIEGYAKTRGIIAIADCSAYLQAAHWYEQIDAETQATRARTTAREHCARYLNLVGSDVLRNHDRAQLETLEDETEREWRRGRA